MGPTPEQLKSMMEMELSFLGEHSPPLNALSKTADRVARFRDRRAGLGIVIHYGPIDGPVE